MATTHKITKETDSFFNPDSNWMERIAEYRNKRSDITIPETCKIPSPKEIKEKTAVFNEYWGNNKKKQTGWKVLNRISA